MWSTVDELEEHLGEQVRTLRLRADLTIEELAAEAGVAVKTVHNVERGKGSTLATVVRILRALGVENWLSTLAPAEPVSPIAVLEASRRRRPERQRASRSDG